ncbi:hypothetical protein B0H63DRAFT_464044 [Podospora didyma]|uniref:Uncharacterized protein n=1 Tax=Podospora didyma TaxID=330526 RepID=A0AAE0NXN1_9PEZI|nr:hypothetical protein B0H63DRAFT_464044 [Podospora didyma]
MVVEVSGQLLKRYGDDGYQKAFNRSFTDFPKDVGFNSGLSAPQPDLVEGLEMEEYRPFPVGSHIAGAVLYKDDTYSVTLPHLAGEWKGPDGNITEATLQSGYVLRPDSYSGTLGQGSVGAGFMLAESQAATGQ